MTPFDWHKTRYPRTWSEMSFDFRLVFAWHGSMMALMLLGDAASIGTGLLLAALLAGLLVLLSVRYRRVHGWRWPGARTADVASAVFVAVVIALFLYAATPFSRQSMSRRSHGISPGRVSASSRFCWR